MSQQQQNPASWLPVFFLNAAYGCLIVCLLACLFVFARICLLAFECFDCFLLAWLLGCFLAWLLGCCFLFFLLGCFLLSLCFANQKVPQRRTKTYQNTGKNSNPKMSWVISPSGPRQNQVALHDTLWVLIARRTAAVAVERWIKVVLESLIAWHRSHWCCRCCSMIEATVWQLRVFGLEGLQHVVFLRVAMVESYGPVN